MKDRFMEFTISISRMNKLVQKLKTEGMKLFGLKASDTLCLYRLMTSEEGLTFSEIAQSCDLDPALVSRLLKELVANGMVEKDGKPGKYHAKYFLTAAAKEKMAEIAGVISYLQELADSGITEEELDAFYSCLMKLTANFEKMADNSGALFHTNKEERAAAFLEQL